MPRTITVKGVGRVSAKPDMVVVSLNLEAKNMEYAKAMETAATQLSQLQEAAEAIGFEKESFKTVNFNVRTEYESVQKAGTYQRKFAGYVVHHSLKLEFDFELERLSQVLDMVSKCLADPELNISFTVKDVSAVKEEMLRAAAENAKSKAEVLCAASGVKLGGLLNIEYNWGEINVFSNTGYALEQGEAAMPLMARSMDITPEDIKLSDTATFVWELE